MKPNNEYTIAVGKQVVIWITGRVEKFVAEITKVDPLQMKVMEDGPYAHLKEGDYILLPKETIAWQADGVAKGVLLYTSKQLQRPVLSGLKALGVADSILHEILAPDYKQNK